MLSWFLIAAILSFVFSAAVRRIALRYRIVDMPGEDRKIHLNPVPLLGGVGVYLSFAATLLFAATTTGRIVSPIIGKGISWQMIIGVLAGGLVLMIGGVLDDIYRLKAKQQIWFPILAALIVVICGVGVSKLTNPLGGIILLAAPLSGIVVFPWLMGTSYATKLFDGLDGLVTGLTVIGALLIMMLGLTTKYYQPDVALIAIIAAGAFIGFLPWNFHPARMFLGEGGSLFAGYMLGVLSVISGAKIAVALMALGVAVIDAGWVILRRVWQKSSIASADRKHLHFRLLDAGLSHRTSVIFIWFISAAFGAATLTLQSSGKLIAFIILAVVTLVVGLATILQKRK